MSAEQSAVSFAAKMIRDGEYVGTAIRVAASYYRVDYAAVQRGLAARSGRSQKGKLRPRAQVPNVCMECGQRPPAWHARPRCGYMALADVYTCTECGPHLPSWYECGSGRAAVTDVAWGHVRTSVTPAGVSET